MSRSDTKPCKKCGATDRFDPKGKIKTGRCRPCTQNYKAAWYDICKERSERSRLKRKYGITPERRQTMWKDQEGICLICKKDEATVVDHCHITDTVRGLLCHSCNLLLGQAKDNIEILRNAIEYLDN